MDDEVIIINKGLSYEDDDFTTQINFICPNCRKEFRLSLRRDEK